MPPSRRDIRKLQILYLLLLLHDQEQQTPTQTATQQTPPQPQPYPTAIPSTPITPRNLTTWQRLSASGSTSTYLRTMGLTPLIFTRILSSGFSTSWTTSPIPRNDVKYISKPRASVRSLDAAGALGLVLHHVNSSLTDPNLQRLFGLSPAVCSRYRHRALRLLLVALRGMEMGRICWPGAGGWRTEGVVVEEQEGEEREQEGEESEEEEMSSPAEVPGTKYDQLEKMLGVVKTWHLPVSGFLDSDVQDGVYQEWCERRFVRNILVFAPDGTIVHATINAPSSWNEKEVAKDLLGKLRNDVKEDYWVLADEGFHVPTDIRERVRTFPGPEFENYPEDPFELANFMRYCDQLRAVKEIAEWGITCIQGSFGRLKIPLPADDTRYRNELLEICCRLHNVRIRAAGMDKVRTDYEAIWKSGGDYTEFREMKFRDIKKNDRLRKFYDLVT